MEIVLQSFKVRNDRNTAFLVIEKSIDKYGRIPFWNVYVKQDRSPFAYVLKSGLKNRPTKGQIQRYLESI